MKEHIYTIPINEAFDKDCECPICEFMRNEENDLIEYTLGASMMEPDERERSNASGYCKHHFSMLLQVPNKLSMALVLQTHLEEIRRHIENDKDTVTKSKKSLFGKSDDIADVTSKYNKITDSCVICEKMRNTEDKFIDNIIELYKKEDEFRTKFKNTKGFCFPHFTALAEHSSRGLSGAKREEFLRELYDIEIKHLKRVQDDIDWFTKKFDFRFAKEDWKTSRDAVPRTTEKIIGFVSKDEK